MVERAMDGSSVHCLSVSSGLRLTFDPSVHYFALRKHVGGGDSRWSTVRFSVMDSRAMQSGALLLRVCNQTSSDEGGSGLIGLVSQLSTPSGSKSQKN